MTNLEQRTPTVNDQNTSNSPRQIDEAFTMKAMMEQFKRLNFRLDGMEDAMQTNREELHETRKLVTKNQPPTPHKTQIYEKSRNALREPPFYVETRIPHFKGTKDPYGYLEWEEKVEAIFECNDYSERQKVRVTTLEFLDNASNWWDKLVYERKRDEEEPVRTWKELRKLMRKQFVPDSYLRRWEGELHFERQMKRSSYFKSPPPLSDFLYTSTSKEYFETPMSIVDLPHIDIFQSKSFGSILPPKEMDRNDMDQTKELLRTKDVECYESHSLEHDTSSCPQNEALNVLSSGVLEQVGEEKIEAYGLEEESERVILEDPNKGDKNVEEGIIKDPLIGVDNEEELLKLVKECQDQHVYYDLFLENFEEDKYDYFHLEDLVKDCKERNPKFMLMLALNDVVEDVKLLAMGDPAFTFDPGGYSTFMIRGRIIFEEGGYDEIPNPSFLSMKMSKKYPKLKPTNASFEYFRAE